MAVETKKIMVETKWDTDIVDITDKVQDFVKESKTTNGSVTVFVRGSTASVSTMEYEPNLVKDIEKAIERIAPSSMIYAHHKTWGDDNGKSHVRATLIGPSITIPFESKTLLLGRWQQIILMDFDVISRSREIILQIVGD
jgi:secondary thiamine-phosphate synthase enzyme